MDLQRPGVDGRVADLGPSRPLTTPSAAGGAWPGARPRSRRPRRRRPRRCPARRPGSRPDRAPGADRLGLRLALAPGGHELRVGPEEQAQVGALARRVGERRRRCRQGRAARRIPAGPAGTLGGRVTLAAAADVGGVRRGPGRRDRSRRRDVPARHLPALVGIPDELADDEGPLLEGRHLREEDGAQPERAGQLGRRQARVLLQVREDRSLPRAEAPPWPRSLAHLRRSGASRAPTGTGGSPARPAHASDERRRGPRRRG